MVIFIYFIEERPRFLPLLEPLFRGVDDGRRELVTSALTLLEVLVVPYRSGDHLLAERYEALLTQSRGVRVAEISRDHLRAAAQLRAETGVQMPDMPGGVLDVCGVRSKSQPGSGVQRPPFEISSENFVAALSRRSGRSRAPAKPKTIRVHSNASKLCASLRISKDSSGVVIDVRSNKAGAKHRKKRE